MSNYINHKKEVLGESDMKVLAEKIGDLHYETLSEFICELSDKLFINSRKAKPIVVKRTNKTTDIADKYGYYTGIPEISYCVRFGCGKILNITEKLFGNKCLGCFGNKEIINLKNKRNDKASNS